MRDVRDSGSRLILYFLVGFFFTTTCLLGLTSPLAAIATAPHSVGQMALLYDEERAANSLMLCVWSGGKLVYDPQMRFSHCESRTH